jgi:hypothetical protein
MGHLGCAEAVVDPVPGEQLDALEVGHVEQLGGVYGREIAGLESHGLAPLSVMIGGDDDRPHRTVGSLGVGRSGLRRPKIGACFVPWRQTPAGPARHLYVRTNAELPTSVRPPSAEATHPGPAAHMSQSTSTDRRLRKSAQPEDSGALQRDMELGGSDGLGEVSSAELLEPTEPVAHCVAMNVQSPGGI